MNQNCYYNSKKKKDKMKFLNSFYFAQIVNIFMIYEKMVRKHIDNPNKYLQ